MDKFNWIQEFDERQQKEIELAQIYTRDFHHGTTGHNALLVIAKMAFILDGYQRLLDSYQVEQGPPGSGEGDEG